MVSVPDAYDADGNKSYAPTATASSRSRGRPDAAQRGVLGARRRVFREAERLGFLLL